MGEEVKMLHFVGYGDGVTSDDNFVFIGAGSGGISCEDKSI